jgi:cobalt-zinc-cadmium efflux system outer membrane protein
MLAALIAVALASPNSLRLADLLREARDKNPDLKAAQARAASASSAVSPAGALDDPMLMIQLWNAPADFSNVPVMVQLSQNLPLGGKRAARRDAAAADVDAAKANATVQLHDLEVQVAQAYFDLFLAERTQQVDDELDRLLQALLQTSESRVATGKGEQVELLRAQAAIIQLRSDHETANDHRASSWARLAALLDRDSTAGAGSTTNPGVLTDLPPEAALRDRALRERPDLTAARAMIKNAEAQVRLAQAAKVPDIAPFAAFMHTFNGVGETNFVFAGVQGNLPLFGGSKNEPRISSAGAQVIAMREAEHAVRNRVVSEVAESYAHVLAEAHQIELHHQLIPLSRQTVESAEHSYAAGRTDFTMVLDSVRDFRMHELDLAQHLAMYEGRLAELQRAVGGDIGVERAAEAGHADEH